MTTHNDSLTARDLAGVADWFKSSYSGNGNNCLEAADLTKTAHNGIAVRDSKDPHGPALLFASDAYTAFVANVRTGQYDI